MCVVVDFCLHIHENKLIKLIKGPTHLIAHVQGPHFHARPKYKANITAIGNNAVKVPGSHRSTNVMCSCVPMPFCDPEQCEPLCLSE